MLTVWPRRIAWLRTLGSAFRLLIGFRRLLPLLLSLVRRSLTTAAPLSFSLTLLRLLPGLPLAFALALTLALSFSLALSL